MHIIVIYSGPATHSPDAFVHNHNPTIAAHSNISSSSPTCQVPPHEYQKMVNIVQALDIIKSAFAVDGIGSIVGLYLYGRLCEIE